MVVDEIGKMELFSPSFSQAVLQIMDGGQRVLGTIMLGPDPRADAIKRHLRINLVTVTRANRREVLAELLRWLND